MAEHKDKVFQLSARSIATCEPVTICPNKSVEEALLLMDEHQVTSLIVIDNEKVIGVLKK
jgi:arabinose-5-phosphate isomerase